MTIKTITVDVIQRIKVTVDSDKLNSAFNEAFSEMMWDVDCLEDHAAHLAQMKARERIGMDKFVEGYGDIRKMNITIKHESLETEIIE